VRSSSGGTGLGLSIALEDARLHGGWLQAWGEPGRGAAFRLTLPTRAGQPVARSPLPLADSRPAPAAPDGTEDAAESTPVRESVFEVSSDEAAGPEQALSAETAERSTGAKS
jgi:two-component system sensor histidine kinase MtrB